MIWALVGVCLGLSVVVFVLEARINALEYNVADLRNTVEDLRAELMDRQNNEDTPTDNTNSVPRSMWGPVK